MMLLRTTDLRSPEPPPIAEDRVGPFSAITTNGQGSFVVGRHGVDLKTVIPSLQPERFYDTVSIGDWSLHEMLVYLVRETGPARLSITSWGISTKPVQAIADMVRDGRVQHLTALFDSRVKLECPQAYQILLALAEQPNVTIRLAKIHAKVNVIRNDRWSVTVLTSANLTTNPRIESYEVCTMAAKADFHAGWIDQVMAGAQPFGKK